MTTQKEARKAMAESLQHQEHIHENMQSRSQEEIEQSLGHEIEEEARELMVEQRQHTKHIKETMLSRSEEAIGQTEN